MKPTAYKKVLWALLAIFTIILCGFLVFLYGSSFTKDFPERNELLTAMLILSFGIVPLAFTISYFAKKANSRIICISSVVFSCLCLLVTLIFVAGLIGESISDDKHIPDVNSDADTALAVIEPFQIVSSKDDYAAFSKTERYCVPTTNVDGELKKNDYQECALISPKISGIKTLQATKTDCNQLTLDVTSRLEEGNMEIVIVVDDQFYASVPVNQEYSITLNDIAGKTVLVKIAAESAKMEAYVKRTPF